MGFFDVETVERYSVVVLKIIAMDPGESVSKLTFRNNDPCVPPFFSLIPRRLRWKYPMMNFSTTLYSWR